MAERRSYESSVRVLAFWFGSTLGVLDDIDDEDVIDFIFGQGRLSLDAEGELNIVSKPETLELDKCDHRHMYHARVLEGDLPLVPVAPVLWEPIVRVEGLGEGGGLQVVVDDIAESMKGVADEVVESVLENIVMEMVREVACEVCFEEDAPDV